MPNGSQNAEWADIHTTALVHGLISIVLTHRPELRSIPALESVSNNGGDRINKKVLQILTRMAEQYPGCQGAVKELVMEVGRKKRGGETPSPRKKRGGDADGGETASPSKTRKEAVSSPRKAEDDTPSPSKKSRAGVGRERGVGRGGAKNKEEIEGEGGEDELESE